MAFPERCNETGELIKTVMTVRCNKRFDKETGEPCDGHFEGNNKFKIPSKDPLTPKPPFTLEKKRPRFTMKCLICLAVLLISIFEPALGITLVVALEGLVHMLSHYHTKCSSTCKPPQPVVTFFSEFCGICQAQRRMNAVGKFQDRRYMQYISNILAT